MSAPRPESPPPAYGATGPPPTQSTQPAAEAPPPTNATNQPPGYAAGGYPNEPPPSYYSLYGQVKDIKSESSGPLDFLRKLGIFLLGTIACTVCLGVTLAIPISMIVVGSLYLYQCPVERYVPIYLIVGGSVGIFKTCYNLCQRSRRSDGEDQDQNIRQGPLDGLLNCFLLAWFIAGNVWVYRAYEPNTSDADSSLYCHPTVYWFAYWLLTSVYILMALTCCCMCCAGIYGWKSPSREEGV